MNARDNPQTGIGMSGIKARRLGLPVDCRAGDYVGDYVPFYLCSRSVMLYILYQGNHPELTYRGGQAPIVHLEADLHETIDWAEQHGRRWAFSRSNAGASYVEFFNERGRLDEINWPAVAARISVRRRSRRVSRRSSCCTSRSRGCWSGALVSSRKLLRSVPTPR